MKNNLIVKDNALVSASYYLSLAEQRLILLGIVEARNNQSQDNEFIIHHLLFNFSQSSKIV